jgi:hypothetical protein
MADLPETSNKSDVRPNRRSTPGTPRWVKVSAIIALALVLLFAILHLTGNSPFGPGRHGDAGDTPSVTLATTHHL